MEKPIVVLHLIDHFGIGGAQEILVNIGQYANPTVTQHHYAALYGPTVRGEQEERSQISVIYLAQYRYQFLIALYHLFQLVRKLQPQILNVHLEYSTLVGLFLKPFLQISVKSLQLVITIHALKEQLPRWFYPLMSVFIQRAQGVVVEDQISRKQVTEIPYPSDRIAYIPIGTDYGDRWGQTDSASLGTIREEFSIPAAAPLILNIARLHPAKGQSHLIQAFQKVLKTSPNAYLIIVGGGQAEAPLKDLTRRLNLGSHVIFPGIRWDLQPFYTDADVFTMTALDEGMGVVIYQAMAMGLPIVAYDAGSIAEVVQDQLTGFLVPCGDIDRLAEVLIKILSDCRHYRATWGKLAQKRVKTEFSAQTMVKRYEQFYQEVVARS